MNDLSTIEQDYLKNAMIYVAPLPDKKGRAILYMKIANAPMNIPPSSYVRIILHTIHK